MNPLTRGAGREPGLCGATVVGLPIFLVGTAMLVFTACSMTEAKLP